MQVKTIEDLENEPNSFDKDAMDNYTGRSHFVDMKNKFMKIDIC